MRGAQVRTAVAAEMLVCVGAVLVKKKLLVVFVFVGVGLCDNNTDSPIQIMVDRMDNTHQMGKKQTIQIDIYS
eukprot:gene13480-9288_t